MSEKKRVASRAARQISYFFKQTFRRHTGGEYSELLTRGVRSEEGHNRQYPWAYIRLFTFLFTLYAVFLLIIRFTGNELFAPTVTVLASLLFNIPFLLFVYELYPNNDISIMGVVCAVLIGGTAACVLTQILYNIFPAPNKWIKAVYAGLFEEAPKALITCLTIIIARKKSPLSGFLYGAAVGCGFSVVEDMGYIFVQSNELPAMNLNSIITVCFSRGFTAFCTHILWTAFVGWIYTHFDRRVNNFCFFPALALVCGLHICWDLPLSYVARGFVCAGCALVIVVICITVLYKERSKFFRSVGAEEPETDYYVHDEISLDKSDHKYWSYWGKFTMVLSVFLMAFASVIYCAIPFRETYGTERFSSPQEFVEFMQEGKQFEIDNNRAYNSHDAVNDVDKKETDGVLTSVTQLVEKEGVTYKYKYTASFDEVSGRYYFFLADVSVEIENEQGAYITYIKEDLYNNGILYASFFRLNGDVTGFNFESDGDVTVFIYDAGFVRDLSEPRYIALFGTLAGLLGLSFIVAAGLGIKSRKVKKLCSKKNASSAE